MEMTRKPSIAQRARVAWHVFRRGVPQARVLSPEARKSSPYTWAPWQLGRPQWQLIDYATYVAEGFNSNSLIYSAIMYKARSLGQVPLRAYTGDRDNPEPLDEGHPLAKLAMRPNPRQDFSEFQRLNDVYLNVAGNSYLLMDRPKAGGMPEAMYPMRPDRVVIVPIEAKGASYTIAYLYVPEGKSAWAAAGEGARRGKLRAGEVMPMLPQDVMHVKFPNPGDPLEGMGYGLSPMSSSAYSIDVDNDATRFLKIFFQRGTMSPGLVSFDTPLPPDVPARVQERFEEVYGGVDNWYKPIVLERGGKYQRLTPTFEEMGFHNIDSRDESRILGPFGVPPILIGTRTGLERSTYSNYREARKACWEDTLVPELGMFEVDLQYYLQGDDDDSFVAYDLSRVPALQTDVPALTEAAHRMWSMGVPADVAFSTVGLSVETIPDGETAYVPLGVMPVGSSRPKPVAGGAAGGQGTEGEGERAGAEEDTREEDAKKAPSPARPGR